MTGYLCLTFDDGSANQYAVAYPILASANIPATLYIPSSFVGTTLTAANLATMEAGGWEIGSHCVTHTNLTTISLEDATTQLTDSKTALEALGLTITTVSYPFGGYNANIQAVAAGLYARQRTTDSAALGTRYFPSTVQIVGSVSPTTLASTQTYIDNAIATDSICVLRLHTLSSDGTIDGTDYTIQDLVAYIVAKQTSNSLTVVKFNDLESLNNVYIWDGGGADALASTKENWTRDIGGTITNDIAPITDGEIIFNSTSADNCTWDIDAATATVYKITLDTGYSGVITQSADIGVGTGGLSVVAGTLTGDAVHYLKTYGPITVTTGTVTANLTKVEVLADGVTITGFTNPKEIKATANTIFASSSTIRTAMSIASGKTVTVNSGTTLSLQNYNAGYAYSNLGRIITLGTGYFRMMINASMTFTPGDVGNTLFEKTNAASDLVITLGTNTAFGGYLTITSLHATNTLTIDMGGKTLSATAITVSTRGILTNSGASAACSCSGAFTVSGASSVVSGAIVLTYGTYVQSNGTATQVGNWSGGAVTASGGTLTGAGSASVTLTSSGDVNLTGATVTADKLNIVMTGASKTLTTTATLFGLKASAYTNIAASCGITAGAGSHLTVDAGAFLNIANTKVLTLPLYADGATLVPNGPIGGAGTLAITMSDGDRSTRLGTILCPLTIASINTAAANRVLTVLDNPSLAAVTVSSSDDDKTTTLDFADRSANISGAVTSGTRGNILWGEGVHHLGGNLDTSAGAADFETSQIVFTKSSTLKTAAEQPLYDMLIAPNVSTTLGSDVTVSHVYGNGGELIPGAFALTASGSSYDKVLLPTVLSANISPLLSPTGGRFMRRLERVQ